MSTSRNFSRSRWNGRKGALAGLIGMMTGFAAAPLLADSDIDQVAQRYCAFLLQEKAEKKDSEPAKEEETKEATPAGETADASAAKPVPRTAKDLAAALKPDGTWDDIQYSKDNKVQIRYGFCGGAQAVRVQVLALGYRDPKDPAYNDPAVLAAFHSAIQYWMHSGFRGSNWFWNEIAVPTGMGNACLLMKDQLTPEEVDYCHQLSYRKTTNRAGQNGVSAGKVDLITGLVIDDASQVAKGFGAIFRTIVAPDKEGLQLDNSFHQHHDNVYMGNYGLAFALDESTWFSMAQGTHFADQVTPGQKELLRNYIIHGLAEIDWKGRFDLAVMGRQMHPDIGGQRGAGAAADSVFKVMAQADPDGKDLYEALLDFNLEKGADPLLGEKVFYDSDMMVHRRPGFYFSVRGSSPRVKTTESTGSENPHGFYLGDGINCLLRTGHEYDDILAEWDWSRIPGVTAPWSEPVSGRGEDKGGSEFVGGVSDGTNGCFAFDLKRAGIAGHKSWFMADDVIVALGAGLTVDRPVDLGTTLNQCLRQGPITLWQKGASTAFTAADQTFSDLQAVDHDGIRYLFPEPQSVVVRSQKLSGNWASISRYTGDAKPDVSADIFQLGIDHGNQPSGASYSYIILPMLSPAAGATPVLDAKSAGVAILVNTPGQQAVMTNKGLVEAVFYEPGQIPLPDHSTLEAKAPCVVMVDLKATPVIGWVADPTHKLASVDIVANGQSQTAMLPTDKPGDAVKITW